MGRRRENALGRLLLPACRGQGQLRGGDAREAPAGRQAGLRSWALQGAGGTQGFAEGTIQRLGPKGGLKGTHLGWHFLRANVPYHED